MNQLEDHSNELIEKMIIFEKGIDKIIEDELNDVVEKINRWK